MKLLTRKMKRQLAVLMICALFFSSGPMQDFLVYAQENGNTSAASSGSTAVVASHTGEDPLGSGHGSDGEIPSHDGFDYEGWSKVADANDDIVGDISDNDISDIDITNTMRVYAKGTVICKIEIRNVQDIDKVKVFDELPEKEMMGELTPNDITDEIEKDDLGDNKWRITIPVSEEGEHVIKLKYQKENSTPKEFAKSATIIVDKTEAKLDVSCSDLQSAWREDPVNRDKQLSGEQIEEANALYFKKSTNLYFTITEEHFREEDVKFEVDSNDVGLSWDGSDDENTAEYEISGMGEHTVCLNYQDRSKNEQAIKFPTRVILDDTDPILDTVSYTEWDHVVSSGDLSTIDGYREGQSQGVNLYYGLDEDGLPYNVNMTFTIEEANFHGEDVVIKDNGELVLTSLEWIQGTGTKRDFWTTTYAIPKDNVGKHVVTLEYSDRSGNSPIVYTSETIILDFQNPEISFGNNFTTDGEDGGKIVYCGEGQKVNLIIDEENFRATDVTISSGDVAAKELVKKINAELIRNQSKLV